MLLFGLLGFVFKQLDMSPGAVVLGLILGPIAEEGLVQASLMAQAVGLLSNDRAALAWSVVAGGGQGDSLGIKRNERA